MSFKTVSQPSLLQAPLGTGAVTVFGAKGLCLTGLTSFHLDEGPGFSWLNIYRTLADGTQLEVTRDRAPAEAGIEDGDAVVRWAPCDAVRGTLSARYHIVEDASAVDVTFGFESKASYSGFEVFIANYFTPYYAAHYAIRDNRTHPEGVFWYQKQWYGEGENESWARDDQAEALFRDVRWQTGYPLNWRRGPYYAHPLMTQEHRYGHAILLMARPEDCIGLSGLNDYHNAQYFHLFGKDTAPGDRLAATVRMVLLTKYEDLQREAVERYEEWVN